MEIIRGYEQAFHQMTADYSVDASVVAPYMTAHGIDVKRAFQDELREQGVRLVGSSEFRNEALQEYDSSRQQMVILVCEDFRGVRVMNEKGEDITRDDRPDSATARMELVQTADGLRLDEDFVWSGASVC